MKPEEQLKAILKAQGDSYGYLSYFDNGTMQLTADYLSYKDDDGVWSASTHVLAVLLDTEGCKAAYGEEKIEEATDVYVSKYQWNSVQIIESWHSEEGNNWRKAIKTAYKLLPNEYITVSLEVAREMKKAGWGQKAIWFWTTTDEFDPFLYGAKMDGTQPTLTPPSSDREYFAAPTVEEILRELPKEIVITPAPFAKGGWRVAWDVKNGRSYCDTPSNAAAKMWIYLKENNLLDTIKES